MTEEYNEHMNTSTANSTLMQEAYCTDLARELHDFLGQKLFVTNLLIEKSSQRTSERNIKKQLLDASRKLNKTIGAVRELSLAMNSMQKHNVFFYISLENLFTLFEQASNLKIEFKRFHAPEELTDKAKEHIYRIIQEALTNTAKHAQANEVAITLSQKKGELHIKFVDDGLGVNTETLKFGSGLFNIKKRAAELQGAVKYSSCVGKYFQIDISLPAESIYKIDEALEINTRSK